MVDDVLAAQTRLEQQVIDRLYERLDGMRERTSADLAEVRRTQATGTHQARSERDAFATLYENRLAQLWAVEDRLCFGRLDLAGGEHRYVGRIGLADEEQRRLLVDWRADAAMPFYQATAARPGDVVRRRHMMTRGRAVVGVEDEVLDLEALDDGLRSQLSGEGALLAAVNAQRTGRMGDIVATIQAEQDRIIRSDLAGVLVVQGGPGTGKTAVALHRAAYLLYTYRERLAGSGVLVVGPSPVFLRYIERVLPSLGETGVVMLTAGQLVAGVEATRADEPRVARIKGDLRMVDAIAAAVAARQRVPSEPAVLSVEGQNVTLTPRAVAMARDKARRTGKPHNQARVTFVKDLLAHLADRMARAQGAQFDPEDRGELINDLRSSVDVRRALNLAWMPLTPQRVVSTLLGDADRLRDAAPWLDDDEVAALLRDRDAPFTVDDVPLLDEAAELLGEDDAAAVAEQRAAAAQRRTDVEYARGVVEMTGAGAMVTGEHLAQQLADQFGESRPDLSVAERAASDRTWAFGHIVVDEAQELSPMMWRLLARRVPSKSMTVVGDLAQTRSAAGADDWGSMLAPFVEDRWRTEELTVSYRTPSQIMEVAASLLKAIGSSARAPSAVREGRHAPRAVVTDVDTLPKTVVEVVRAQLADLAGGKVAVIATSTDRDRLVPVLVDALDEGAVGTGWNALDRDVAVLDVAEAKGLEFDGVVLVEPATVLEAGAKGAGDLYVALTRATQQLVVVHSRPLPPGLEGFGY